MIGVVEVKVVEVMAVLMELEVVLEVMVEGEVMLEVIVVLDVCGRGGGGGC